MELGTSPVQSNSESDVFPVSLPVSIIVSGFDEEYTYIEIYYIRQYLFFGNFPLVERLI